MTEYQIPGLSYQALLGAAYIGSLGGRMTKGEKGLGGGEGRGTRRYMASIA